MSKEELGGFTDFASVLSILIVLTSFDLSQAIIRSKAEHEEDIDSFIWSILSLSTIWTLFVYAVFLIFPTFFGNLLKMDWKYIHIMFWYALTAPPFTMLITKQRAYYKYKCFVLYSGIMIISGTLMSLVLVFVMQDKLTGRLIGYYSPYVVFGGVSFFYLLYKGRKIKMIYWKYAMKLCLPLVPHDLSLHILGVSDVLLITRICGKQYTAFYSVAYSAYHIASAFFDAMNKAWAPWLIESLHYKNHEQIRKASRTYVALFAAVAVGILLCVPEIILILGGKRYARAMYCLPPLVTSCTFLFMLSMYVNIEFFEKKTFGVSFATMMGTIVNIALNLILLHRFPEDSYIVAAYTTLIGYMVIFTFHYFFVRRMKMDHVYDTRVIFGVLIGIMSFAGLMNILYSYTVIRWSMILVYAGVIGFVGVKHFDSIKQIIYKRK